MTLGAKVAHAVEPLAHLASEMAGNDPSATIVLLAMTMARVLAEAIPPEECAGLLAEIVEDIPEDVTYFQQILRARAGNERLH